VESCKFVCFAAAVECCYMCRRKLTVKVQFHLVEVFIA